MRQAQKALGCERAAATCLVHVLWQQSTLLLWCARRRVREQTSANRLRMLWCAAGAVLQSQSNVAMVTTTWDGLVCSTVHFVLCAVVCLTCVLAFPSQLDYACVLSSTLHVWLTVHVCLVLYPGWTGLSYTTSTAGYEGFCVGLWQQGCRDCWLFVGWVCWVVSGRFWHAVYCWYGEQARVSINTCSMHQ